MRGALESTRHGVAIAVLVLEGEIVGQAVVQPDRPLRQAIGGIDDDRQVLVIDGDPLGGILRDILGFGDDQRHRLADEAHAPVRQCRAKRIAQGAAAHALEERERRRALPTGRDHVLAGHDVQHAGKRPGFSGIDADDPRMRAVGAQEMRAHLPRQVVIGGVAATAGDQAEILAAALVLVVGQLRTSPVAVPGIAGALRPTSCPYAEVHTWR